MKVSNRIIITIMLIVMTAVPCFANMPVIDVSAIATSVSNFVQQVNAWKREIQQYKDELDRITKAAKGLASGDFTVFLTSLGDLTGQVSSWNIAKSLGAENYANLDKVLANTSDASYSLASLIQTDWRILLNNLNVFKNALETNAKKVYSIVDGSGTERGDGYALGGVSSTLSAGTDVMSSLLSVITEIATTGGEAVQDASEVWNNFADILNVTPDEYAKVLTEIKTDTLSSMFPKASISSTDDLASYLETLAGDYSTKQKELVNINSEENPEQYEKQLQLIAQAKEDMETAQKAYDWAKQMDSAIADVKAQQEVYESTEAWKTKKAAQSEAERKLAEYANTINMQEVAGKTWQEMYQEYIGTDNERSGNGIPSGIRDAQYYR